jgi:hypothetical protein
VTRRIDERERWVAKDRARRAADGLPTHSVRRKIGNRGQDVLWQANRMASNIDVFSKDDVDRARFGRNT